MYFAHFAISDIETDKFRYEHIRSFNTPLDLPVSMSESRYDLRLGNWTIREEDGVHILHSTLGSDLVFDAVLKTSKPVVLNGEGGDGISRKTSGASAHFSFTRMNVSGHLANGTGTEEFTGSAWMDREFGTWEQTNWDWFSIQFDDETELMIYQYRTKVGDTSPDTTGTFVDKDGNCTYLNRKDYTITVSSTWTSPNTGTEYPSRWQIVVPCLDITLDIEPFIEDQELDTRGTTMIVYWEGACKVTGKRAEKTITGRAYVELVGYVRSHETASLADFLFGDPMRRVRGIFG